MKNGFTLIELLAVIVIQGLLALVVTQGIAKEIKNSKINTAEVSLEGYVREVENAGALYMTETGLVPTNVDDLVLDGKNLNQIENANVTFNAGGQVSRATASIDGLSCVYVEGEGAECIE